MHQDRVIVHIYRHPDGLSTIPDDQTTLTRQSADTNDAPRDPLHGPVTWNHDRTHHYSTLHLCLRLQSVTITASTVLLRQEPAHRCIRYPTLAPSSASAVPSWQPFLTRFDSQFPILLDSIVLLFDYTQFFYFFFNSIFFRFYYTQLFSRFDSSHTIRFPLQ